MKNKKSYLSRRVALVMWVIGGFNFLFLAGFWAIAIRNSRPLWPWILLTVLFLAVYGFCWRYLYVPYRETEKIYKLFATGYTFDGVFEMRHQVSPGSEKAIRHIKELVSADEWLNASKRQAQYLALQNQINPHFLYNTLEGIRGEALACGNESIAMMTEALATFFRYTISKVENLATLEDELFNVENYFLIQQYRFGKRLSLMVEFDSEDDKAALMQCCLPKLTLQPIVENAIVHGLEGKIGNGCVTIRVQGTEKRMIITVRDDGLGMNEQQVNTLRHRLSISYADNVHMEREGRGGIAIANVNNRIRLLFGENYGILVYSVLGQGTDVELTLPLMPKTARRQDAL